MSKEAEESRFQIEEEEEEEKKCVKIKTND